ncbi:MAG: DUF4157 domain-containing protein [Deltaproteobacteria bacterium]|nr:DUF4157 domain-containing protein [Deltaproteobacteria bacterium]
MADSSSSKLAQRLLTRASREGLQRKQLADGGEVYSGPLATRALRAMGARAMTMDHTMFVAEDFDVSNAEDQALYAHEQIHMSGSGGTDSHGERDHEEVSARSVERMVLQRAQEGEAFSSIMRDVKDGGTKGDSPSASSLGDSGAPEVTAEMGLAELLGQGMSHDAVVRRLTRKVLDMIGQMEESTTFRSTETETF